MTTTSHDDVAALAARSEELSARGARHSDGRALRRPVSLASSFQKEETVLLDMLFGVEPKARVFAIDARYLFPETYELWREVERRYDTKIEVFEGPSAEELTATTGEALGAQARPLPRRRQGRAARPRARRPRLLDHRRPPRPVADARGHAEARLGRAHELWKANPLADWSDDDCWTYIRERGLPYNALPTAATRRSATPTRRSRAPAARAAGPAATGPSADCTIRRRSRRYVRGRDPSSYSHLDELEAEAIHIMRELAAELERPVLLFSGGKDSIVLLRLAEKAFRPASSPSRSCTSTPATTSRR